jgi:hypothetical protein
VIPPTTADIHAWSKVDWNELSVDDVGLAELIARASVWVTAITFRPIDSTMPVWMEPLARQAIQMRTEQIAYQEQPDYVETAADDVLSSFSAGGYSESRTDPSRRGESRSLTSWKALSDILWLLMTPDAVAYWTEILSGKMPPAMLVTPVAWGAMITSFPAGAFPLAPYSDPDNIV